MAKWIGCAQAALITLAGASLLALAGLASPVQAQKSKSKAAASQSAWVKLCEQAKYPKRGPDGKPVIGKDKKPVLEARRLCLTHHEQMTPAGVTVISAAIQKLQGVQKMGLMVMVPSAVGLRIPSGMRVFVYDKAHWTKLQKKEKVDFNTLPSQRLVFTMCHQNGCTAENEATPQLIEAMKGGAVMLVMAIHVSGRPIPFRVPLNGFSKTLAGKPVDNVLYKKQRKALWDKIRGNQIQQMKKYQEHLEQQQNKGKSSSGGPAPKR